MLQGEHSAILTAFVKQPLVIKIFVLSIFEWPLKTGLTVSMWQYMGLNLNEPTPNQKKSELPFIWSLDFIC